MKIEKEITRLENIKKYYKCTDEEVTYINQMINNLKTNIEPKKSEQIIKNKGAYENDKTTNNESQTRQ